jgi:uncharacterized protein YjcR
MMRLERRVGDENANAKLDDEKVREICRAYCSGSRMSELAIRFGVAATTISKVIRGERWSHVDIPNRPIATRPGSARGSQHYRAKLNDKKVLQIRNLYRQGWTRIRIGNKFGLSLGGVAGVVKGRNWKHVADPAGPTPPHRPGLPGSRHPNAKLTEEIVREIWSLHSTGMSAAKIGLRFGVSDTTVLLILKRRAWAHVARPLDEGG